MAPEPILAVSASSPTTTPGNRRKWPGLLVVLLALAGSTLTACAPSDEDLVDSLATTDNVEARHEAAVELAGRHSLDATEALVAAATSDANAAAGLAALRDEYVAVLGVPPERELSDGDATALLETVDCLAAIGDAASIAGLSAFVTAASPWTTPARVHAVEVLGSLPPDAALDSLVGAIAIPDGDGATEVRAAAAAVLRTRPEAAANLVAARASAGGDARRAIDPVLTALGEPAAVALIAVMASDEDGSWIPDLLCLIGTPAIAATGPALNDPAASVRYGALTALLCLRSKDPAAVDALLVTPDRAPLLVEARSQAQSWQYSAVIEDLLLGIGEPAVGPLVGLLGATDWAADLLVRFGAVAAPQLVTALASEDPAIRQGALDALMGFYAASPGEAAPFLATPDRVPLLVETYTAGSEGPDSTIGEVLVATGQPAVAVLVGTATRLLTDEAGWTDALLARRVYDLILRFDHEATTSALVDAVAQDPANRLHALFLAVKLGIPGSEDRLNDLLIRHGDKSMAEDFLNSGSDLLYQGGERWATNHGYYVESGVAGSNRTTWGSF